MSTFPDCGPWMWPVFVNTGICEKLQSDSNTHDVGKVLAYLAQWRCRTQMCFEIYSYHDLYITWRIGSDPHFLCVGNSENSVLTMKHSKALYLYPIFRQQFFCAKFILTAFYGIIYSQ